jgi:hypothetical protein
MENNLQNLSSNTHKKKPQGIKKQIYVEQGQEAPRKQNNNAKVQDFLFFFNK